MSSVGTLTAQATISAKLAETAWVSEARIHIFKDIRFKEKNSHSLPKVLFRDRYVRKKIAALGAEPIATDPIPLEKYEIG